MPRYAVLISPRAEAAYFSQTLEVATAELQMTLPDSQPTLAQYGDMRFLLIDADEAALPALLRLSFVQGVFEKVSDGLSPIQKSSDFKLHPDFVWGEKYRGKTNETLTQLLINLALNVSPDATSLCDPMCGRGTTLMWGMRYGLKATGIEQDPLALQDIQRGLKKWTKLHSQKHKLTQGWIQKTNKKNTGRYIEFSAEGTSMRVVTGDTTNAPDLLLNRKFDILATDIPYGIQHMGSKNSRSPIEAIREAADGWVRSLKPNGALAIAFNTYMPKRADLTSIFTNLGFEEVKTTVSHRMSESIVRDVLLMRKPDL